jgi:hypothetical protein
VNGRAARLFSVLLAVAALAPPVARAGTEQFSTFSVEEQERDDESLIDHLLTRTPVAWDEEWARSAQGFRTEQGCLTAGQWFTAIQLKTRAAMGRSAWFGFQVDQIQDDRVDYQFLDLSVHVPTRFGTPFLMFRPFHDKSRQDFALGLDVGADTSAFAMSAVLGLEDAFNNLWAFRQTTLGQQAQPYTRHPYEPALSFAIRQPGWRIEAGGQYLTPGTKRIIVSYADPDLDHVTTLWGVLAWGTLGVHALGLDWTFAGLDQQAKSSDEQVGLPGSSFVSDYRRQWSGEATVTWRMTRRWTVEAHGVYQDRKGNVASESAPRSFSGIDRAGQGEARYTREHFVLRLGYLHDTIRISQPGVNPAFSWGSRGENRAYFGLGFRFGRVWLAGIEGLELDQEPYPVAWIHDKGFLQLQTTF